MSTNVYCKYKYRLFLGRLEFSEGHESGAAPALMYFAIFIFSSQIMIFAPTLPPAPSLSYLRSGVTQQALLPPPHCGACLNACVSIARRVQHILPSSTRVELRTHTLRRRFLRQLRTRKRSWEWGGSASRNRPTLVTTRFTL